MPMQHLEQTTSTAAEIRLGNIWLIAATVATSILGDAAMATGEPAILSIDAAGDLRAVGPEHPEYDARLKAPGFVCAASPNMDVRRLAARIYAAVRAGEAAG